MESMEDYRKLIQKEAKEAFQLSDTSHFSELIGKIIRVSFCDAEISASITSVKCRYKDFLPGQASAYPIHSFFVTLQTDYDEFGKKFCVRLVCYRSDNKICRAVQGELVQLNKEPDWYKMEVCIKSPSTTTSDEWHAVSSTKNAGKEVSVL